MSHVIGRWPVLMLGIRRGAALLGVVPARAAYVDGAIEGKVQAAGEPPRGAWSGRRVDDVLRDIASLK